MNNSVRITVGFLLVVVALPAFSWGAKKNKYEAQQERNVAAREEFDAATDGLVDEMLLAGMGVVVMSTINIDDKYRTEDERDRNNAEYETSETGNLIVERSSMSRWQNRYIAEADFLVGNKTSAKDYVGRGYFYRFTAGPTLYLVYALPPGSYRLASASYDWPRSALPAAASQRSSYTGVGEVLLTKEIFSEYIIKPEWKSALYRTETTQNSFCTSVRVVNNECMSYGTSYNQQMIQERGAGYYNTTTEKKVDGNKVGLELGREFASFDLAAGEVVAVDGLLADWSTPIVSGKPEDCVMTTYDKVTCGMKQVAFTRYPARVQDILANDPAKRGYPKIARALAQVKYRELKLSPSVREQKREDGRPTYVLIAP